MKGNVNEGGIRVPMIAQWPGNIAAGTEADLISAFYDVLPTFCEITGIQAPNDIDGKSFLPTLLGKENQEKHEFLYWEFPESGGQQEVRMGKWKGIRKNIDKDSLRVQLYNLEEDIQELVDVSSQNPEIVEKIESIFKNEHEMAEMEKFRMKALDK